MDFQFISYSNFENEEIFSRAFARELWRRKDILTYMSEEIQ
jgi:hypothetical protein